MGWFEYTGDAVAVAMLLLLPLLWRNDPRQRYLLAGVGAIMASTLVASLENMLNAAWWPVTFAVRVTLGMLAVVLFFCHLRASRPPVAGS